MHHQSSISRNVLTFSIVTQLNPIGSRTEKFLTTGVKLQSNSSLSAVQCILPYFYSYESTILTNLFMMSAMTLSSDGCTKLRSVVFIFIAHHLINCLLLSPLNPLRCLYWDQSSCSVDEEWICNWMGVAHAHVAVVISCMMFEAQSELVEKVAYLCCTIIICYTMEGIFTFKHLNRSLSTLQFVVFIGIIASVGFITYNDVKPSKSQPTLLKMKSSSYDQRLVLPISTIALLMHLIMSFIRVLDVIYWKETDGYRGNSSSATYESISNFATCDMMLICFLLAFALRFCSADQHKTILWGQSGILFTAQVMLAGWQGEQIVSNIVMARSLGTFVAVLIAIVGVI